MRLSSTQKRSLSSPCPVRAGLAGWGLSLLVMVPATAQQATSPPAASVSGATDAGPRTIDDSDHRFTPEERTNIAVYEAVNRSVANINTKATVASGLFLL